MVRIKAPQPQTRARRWSFRETVELIKAWAPHYYNRRHGGQCDVWVLPHQRNRVLSSRELTMEDWRAVADDINGNLAMYPSRTAEQCKRRMLLLKGEYGDELAARLLVRFFPDHSRKVAGADEAVGYGGAGAAPDGRRAATATGDASLALLAAAAVAGGVSGATARGDASPALLAGSTAAAVAAGVSGAAAVQDGSVTGDSRSGTLATQDASVPPLVAGSTADVAAGVSGAAADQDGSAAGDCRRGTKAHMRASMAVGEGAAAACNFFGGAIPKRPRTGGSTSTGTTRAPSVNAVKEEMVRLANAHSGAMDAGRGGYDAGSARGGSAGAIDGSVAALLIT
jgi:hypothetical protein